MIRAIALVLLGLLSLVGREARADGAQIEVRYSAGLLSLRSRELALEVGGVLRVCPERIFERGTCVFSDVPSGDARLIVWKAGARDEALFTRTFEVTGSEPMVLLLSERHPLLVGGLLTVATLTAALAVQDVRTDGGVLPSGGSSAPAPGLVLGLSALGQYGFAGVIASQSAFDLATPPMPPLPLEFVVGDCDGCLVVSAAVPHPNDYQLVVESGGVRQSCGLSLGGEQGCWMRGLSPGPLKVRLRSEGRVFERELVLDATGSQMLRVAYDAHPVRNGIFATGLSSFFIAAGWVLFSSARPGTDERTGGIAFMVLGGLGFVGFSGHLAAGLRGENEPQIELSPMPWPFRREPKKPAVAFRGAALGPSFDGSGAMLAAAWTF